MSEPIRVLMVTPEAAPLAQEGGLGAVIGALAPALRARGLDVRVVLPRYRGTGAGETLRADPRPLGVPLDGRDRWCAVQHLRVAETPIYLIEHDMLFDRPNVYGPPGESYPDNAARFATLCRGALQLCHHQSFWPDVLHCHDWPAALVPVLLNTVGQHTPLAGAASVLTIHNLAHQGWFGADRANQLGLGEAPLDHLGLRHGEGINLLRAGILHSTMVTTVSPTYAQEIQRKGMGAGLSEVLRSRRADLFGVLNGIDVQAWDPEADAHLPRPFSATDLSSKRFCKAAMQQEAQLAPRPEVPLIGFVGRLVRQKGVALIAECLDRLLDLDVQLVLLGEGESWAEALFEQAARRRPDRLGYWRAFDPALAHRIIGASDLFLMPSLWEPCGLTQMHSHRYGTLPIVRATGGLNDTVQNLDEATGVGSGFVFSDPTPEALLGVTSWAVRVYRERAELFAGLQRQVMELRRGWDRAAAAYEYLYRLATVRRHGS